MTVVSPSEVICPSSLYFVRGIRSDSELMSLVSEDRSSRPFGSISLLTFLSSHSIEFVLVSAPK